LTGETYTAGHRLLVLYQAKNRRAYLCTSSDPLTFDSSTRFLIVVVSVHRTTVHTSTFKTSQTSSRPQAQRGHSFSTGTPAIPTPSEAHRLVLTHPVLPTATTGTVYIIRTRSLASSMPTKLVSLSRPPVFVPSPKYVELTPFGIRSHDWISYVVPCRSQFGEYIHLPTLSAVIDQCAQLSTPQSEYKPAIHFSSHVLTCCLVHDAMYRMEGRSLRILLCF
jgi:hypothetical protein